MRRNKGNAVKSVVPTHHRETGMAGVLYAPGRDILGYLLLASRVVNCLAGALCCVSACIWYDEAVYRGNDRSFLTESWLS